MRLTRKLSIAIGLGICLVLALNAWVRVRSDSADYRAEVRRDHDVIGRGLASAVELLWRTDGEARAREVVEELNLRESQLTIRWVWPDADAADSEAPMRPDLVPVPGRPTRSETVVGASGVPHILSYTAVDLPGDRDGAIEMYESLAHERAHLMTTLVRTAFTTGALIAVCVALTFGFGIFFVARPLRKLADKARRIGEGDLSEPVIVEQDDEIREVARAINEMCEKLGETRARLERESAEKLRAVERLRHADRLRTIGQLASTVAHELGTPLNVARVRAAMIADGELPVERLRELGAVVVEQCDRMVQTIQTLLSFARREPADRRQVDVQRPVQEAIEWLRPLAAKRGVRLELEADAPAIACVDPRQIQQAVTNLVLNAVQVSPRDAVVTARVRITEEEEVWIEVEDRGPGVDPAIADSIFEPFFTTKPEGEGTGLGLSIADEIVREHGGRIEATSDHSGGARFRIRLPARSEMPAPAPLEGCVSPP